MPQPITRRTLGLLVALLVGTGMLAAQAGPQDGGEQGSAPPVSDALVARLSLIKGSVSTQRADTAVLWKLDAGHHLVPVRVRTGITNFTATAVTVLQGSLAPGDRLVTGVVMQSQGLSPMAARRFR